MSHPKIAIIGAGPAGLTLARLLQQLSPGSFQVTIFEADISSSERNQGGTLDLHPKLGQLALKEAGLLQEFHKFSRPGGEATKVLKSDGRVLWDDNILEDWRPKDEGEQERPEIDRDHLRELLLRSLHEDTVKWGKKVVEVKEDERFRGKYKIVFVDGTEEGDIDLLIGADGAWSKVRPLLTDKKPYYSGITAIELWAMDVDTKTPWLSNFVGQGSSFMFDKDRALICQRQGSGSIRTYACVRKSEDWLETCGISWDAPGARQQLVDAEFAGCGDDIKRTILESKDVLVPRKTFMMPIGISWPTRPGVTLLGDAAHLMTPFAGVGVNIAMADALDLAKELIAQLSDDSHSRGVVEGSVGKRIAAAVELYERNMFVRAEENAKKTLRGLEGHFSENGSEERANRIRKGYEMVMASREGQSHGS